MTTTRWAPGRTWSQSHGDWRRQQILATQLRRVARRSARRTARPMAGQLPRWLPDGPIAAWIARTSTSRKDTA